MKRLHLAVLSAFIGLAAAGLFAVQPVSAVTQLISFQGKLTNPDGTNVTDNTYSIRFRIYTSASGDTGDPCLSSCKWEETQSVAVSGGLFHVNLGSSTGLPGSVDFDSSSLYLSIKVGADAEMSPRVRLTAAPQALNSDMLDGKDANAFVQLSPSGQQTGNINISGTIASGTINGQTIGSTSTMTGTLTIQGAGALTLGTASTNRGAIILRNSAGANTVTLQAPATNPASSFSLSLPSALGASGDCLKQNDGSGTLAFSACGGTTPDLQAVYAADASGEADITTTSSAKTVLVKAGNTFDSATLFHVQSAASTNLFTVDSANSRVQIGSSTTDATAVLLTVDSYNNSTDPTGVNGSMYYNTSLNKFRCYEGGAWKDCDAASPQLPNAKRWTYIAYSGTGTTWTAVGNSATAAGTGSAIAADATEPARVNYVTTTTNGNAGGLSGNTIYRRDRNARFQAYVQPNATTNTRVWAGLTNQTIATMGASANPAGHYAAFRWDTSASDTTWKCVTKDGTTQNIQNSGATVSTTGVELEIVETTSNFIFRINGATVCTNSTNLPAAGNNMRYVLSNATNNALATNVRYAWIYVDSDR